jgi:hypothetical protein
MKPVHLVLFCSLLGLSGCKSTYLVVVCNDSETEFVGMIDSGEAFHLRQNDCTRVLERPAGQHISLRSVLPNYRDTENVSWKDIEMRLKAQGSDTPLRIFRSEFSHGKTTKRL